MHPLIKIGLFATSLVVISCRASDSLNSKSADSPLPSTNPVATVTVSPSSATGNVGDAAQFTATLKDANGNVLTGRTVTWSSTNTAVATVTDTGYATAVGAGSAAIVAT